MVQTLAFSLVTAQTVEVTHSHNLMFLLYFAMNVVDLATGVLRAVDKHEYSSAKFCNGILKKIARWALVACAVITYYVLIEMGNCIGVSLEVSKTVIWFVLAALTFQDIRSVFDNLIKMGVTIPPMLEKVLALAESKFEESETIFDGDLIVDTSDEEHPYHFQFNSDLKDVSQKDTVTFQIKRR